jgi:hypothetical protein
MSGTNERGVDAYTSTEKNRAPGSDQVRAGGAEVARRFGAITQGSGVRQRIRGLQTTRDSAEAP